MTQVIVAALMWLLTAALAVTAHRRRSQRVLLASAMIACAMTLNNDAVYLYVDDLLAGHNTATLCADLLLVGGVYLLSAAIIGSVREPHASRFSWSAVGLIVTAVTMVWAFSQIDARSSTTRFMADYGALPAAAIYSTVQYIYIAAVMTQAAIVVVRHIESMRSPGYQVGYLSLASGCAVAVLLGADVVCMNVTHMLGASSALRAFQSAYDFVFIMAMVFLCGGLATVATSGLLRSVRRRRREQRLLIAIASIWTTQVGRPAIPSITDDPEARLYRMLVEIQDAQLAGATRALTDQETKVLRRAEDHLSAGASLQTKVDG